MYVVSVIIPLWILYIYNMYIVTSQWSESDYLLSTICIIYASHLSHLLSIYLSVYLPIWVTYIYLISVIYLPSFLSTYLYHLSLFSICLASSSYLSVCLSVYPSMCLSPSILFIVTGLLQRLKLRNDQMTEMHWAKDVGRGVAHGVSMPSLGSRS